MSIAVSSVIKPSKMLLFAVGSLCVGIGLTGCLMAAWQLPDQSIWLRVATGGFIVGLAASFFYRLRRGQSTVRIDISGAGQIRLTRSRDDGDDVIAGSHRNSSLMRLLPRSTLWPQMLLLRMQDDDGQTRILIVLPDSLASDDFRLLSVACRWIAAHNNPEECNII